MTRAITKKRIAADAYQSRGAALEDASAASEKFRGEFESVVVYAVPLVGNEKVAGTGSRAAEAGKVVPAEALVVRQKNRRFSSSLLVVPVGASVSFPNDDPIFHNVFSLSKAKSFDLGYFPQGQSKSVRFTKTGVVDVFCHLHPNMSATILVVPNAIYARPGEDGKFVLQGVPTGEVEIVAWHRAAGFFRRRVTLGKSGNSNELESSEPLHFVLPLREKPVMDKPVPDKPLP